MNASELALYLAALDLAPEPPSLSFLQRLVAGHVARFPFGNLGVLLERPLPLDSASIFDRIVRKHQGGYCYEQNGLFQEVLSALGFEVDARLARVVYAYDDPFASPGMTHRFNVVDLDGQRWVTDVGFSHMGPAAPVPLTGKSVSPRGMRAVALREQDWHLQRPLGDAWHSLYRFADKAVVDADIEMGHFWSSCHPTALFRNVLAASRILTDRTVSIRNLSLVDAPFDGAAQVTDIGAPEQLREALHERFDIALSHTESQRLFETIYSLTSTSPRR